MSPDKTQYNTKKKNRNLLILAGIVILLIIVLIILKKTGAIGGSSEIIVETEKVQKRDIQEVITASGKLKPEKEISISADVSGEIIELTVKEGVRVKKGDLLLRIKPDEYQSQVAEAEAAYKGTVASLDNARAIYDQGKAIFAKNEEVYKRYQVLKEKNAVSSSEFERVEAEYLSVKAQLESARQGVLGAEYNIKSAEARKKKAYEYLYKTTIYSPIDGIVTRLNNQLGERVVGTMQMMGTVIMKIADLSKMEVEVDVNENDIIRIHTGDTARIEVDAFTGQKFKGIVTEIANSSRDETQNLTEQITNFQVKVRILESSYIQLVDTVRGIYTPFRPGMSAMVDINTSKVNGVLSVPILAVTNRDKYDKTDFSKKQKNKTEDTETETTDRSNKKIVVFRYKGGMVKMAEVVTGIQDDTYIEIKSGLKEGEEIISGPYSAVSKLLKDGKKVRKNNKAAKKENSGSR